MEIFFITLIGLCIGSFLNVCIYRIAREESISYPQSHCTTCGYELKVEDLIPVVSYVLLEGKCRSCNEKISIKYPIIELINSIIYILLFIQYGFTLEFIKFCILASLLIVIGFIDFETQYVFNSTIVFGVVIGVISLTIQWFIGKEITWQNILGAIIGFAIIYLIVYFTNGMGYGDIDIAIVCGIFLGVKGIFITLFLAFITGGMIAMIMLALGIRGRKSKIAFGPFLAFGAIITMLWGSNILQFYSNIFL